jgi:voltage-gated potassium channel
MILAIVSVGILVSVLGQMFRYFSTRSLRDVFNAIHDRKVRDMKDHPIICGSSYTLHELLHQMEHCDHAWIIVKTEAEAKRLEAEGYHAHVDDYTTAAALRRAGIDSACCVIACGENDADNAFVTLTAKHTRKDIPVIVRLTRSEHREKLRDAGADEIVVPAELAAMQIRDAILARAKNDEG